MSNSTENMENMENMENVKMYRCPFAGTNNCKGYNYTKTGFGYCTVMPNELKCNCYESGACQVIDMELEKVIIRCPLTGDKIMTQRCHEKPHMVCGFVAHCRV